MFHDVVYDFKYKTIVNMMSMVYGNTIGLKELKRNRFKEQEQR